MNEAGRSSAGERQDAGSGAWKKPLFVVLLLLSGLPVAYYFSYVWWGRGMQNAKPYSNPSPFGGEVPGWRAWVEERVYPVWGPLREWEFWRIQKSLWSQCIESCSGAWVAEDGRVLDIQLRFREDWKPGGDGPWVEGRLRCEDDPRLDRHHFETAFAEKGSAQTVLMFYRNPGSCLQLHFESGGLRVMDFGGAPDTDVAPPLTVLGEFHREGKSPEGLEEGRSNAVTNPSRTGEKEEERP